MEYDNSNLLEILEYINPALCSYQEWLSIGMALHHAGFDVSDWDAWSRNDNRYKSGECERKWHGFNGSHTPVTAGTIIALAKEHGWVPSASKEGYELSWDDEISDEYRVVDTNWIESREIKPLFPEWNPIKELTTYLSTLFQSDENVGYLIESYKDDSGKYRPCKGGNYDRTASELIRELQGCNGDIGAVIGDVNEKAGAWIRFNPLDGNGVKNDNVTAYRYALVEADDDSIEHQNAIIRELELPVAVLVYSGGKSLHAIVKIDADTYEEYRKRVDYLYDICKKNGLKIDTSNRNPSRLSRMPGVVRGEQKQYITAINIGKESYTEWKEWIESCNDDLPDFENAADFIDDLPPLSAPLIHGVLRQGHKMLIAGPSKAGKSFLLIELCIALAEGTQWLGWNCAKGRVLYINLELDRPSCLHRLKSAYEALKITPENAQNIDIWNLRGKALTMDKLAPKLIRRAVKKNYLAIIVDPIYKIITGDENSAEQMAHFCNLFDKICTELGCAVIYCHHHSKGGQGSKRSMDRAAGSGVFARDPDALLDLIELEKTPELEKQQQDMAVCDVCASWLKRCDVFDDVSYDELHSAARMQELVKVKLSTWARDSVEHDIAIAKRQSVKRTAWRIEGTLREFEKFEPKNVWFDYPCHIVDDIGVLGDIQPEGTAIQQNWKKNFAKKKSDAERKNDRKESLEAVYHMCNMDGKVTIQDIADYTGKSEKTVRRHLKEHGGFWIEGSEVGLKSRDKVE